MSSERFDRLRKMQKKLLEVVRKFPDEEGVYLRRQYHPLLSPIAWHIGHCVYIEALWIRGCLLDDYTLAEELASTYQPELLEKAARSSTLPNSTELFVWAQELTSKHVEILSSASGGPSQTSDQLREKKHIAEFLINHHAQHLETIAMVEWARQRVSPKEPPSNLAILKPGDDLISLKSVPGGLYQIGTRGGFSFDNESPQQSVELRPFKVTEVPVNNSQFLAFVEDGGYQNRNLWSNFGWRWRTGADAECPRSWRRNMNGGWYVQALVQQARNVGDMPVTGVTHYEALAFAVWSGLRLIHEYEWEVAADLEILSGRGEVWEWCSNVFHPYCGFVPYTYWEYSVPWFDQRHYVLRGGSWYTESEIRRTSFRNYYLAGADYLFSGIRLAE